MFGGCQRLLLEEGGLGSCEVKRVSQRPWARRGGRREDGMGRNLAGGAAWQTLEWGAEHQQDARTGVYVSVYMCLEYSTVPPTRIAGCRGPCDDRCSCRRELGLAQRATERADTDSRVGKVYYMHGIHMLL